MPSREPASREKESNFRREKSRYQIQARQKWSLSPFLQERRKEFWITWQLTIEFELDEQSNCQTHRNRTESRSQLQLGPSSCFELIQFLLTNVTLPKRNFWNLILKSRISLLVGENLITDSTNRNFRPILYFAIETILNLNSKSCILGVLVLLIHDLDLDDPNKFGGHF